jgi:hypothetical protein
MDAMMDSLPHQVAAGIAVAHVIEYLKNIPGFKWLQNPVAAKIAASVGIVVAAAGVHLQMEGTIDGGGRIMLAWPMLSAMADGIEHMILQWAIQEGYYQGFVKK